MKAFLSYLISILTFLAPIKGLIYLITACVMVDASLAIYIIIYISKHVKFEIDKLLRVFQKLTLYISTIILCFLFDRFILQNELFGVDMFLAKFITSVWVFQEAKSIDKNWVKSGNKSILSAIKDFVSGLKCIKDNYDNFKKN